VHGGWRQGMRHQELQEVVATQPRRYERRGEAKETGCSIGLIAIPTRVSFRENLTMTSCDSLHGQPPQELNNQRRSSSQVTNTIRNYRSGP